MADDYIHEQQASQVFDLLIEELIGEMGIVGLILSCSWMFEITYCIA